jgi:hypothetical protein
MAIASRWETTAMCVFGEICGRGMAIDITVSLLLGLLNPPATGAEIMSENKAHALSAQEQATQERTAWKNCGRERLTTSAVSGSRTALTMRERGPAYFWLYSVTDIAAIFCGTTKS